jgi:hypothetical protein
MPPKAAVKRKAANGYKMPEKLAEGTVLTTIGKKQFRIGKSIGWHFFFWFNSFLLMLNNLHRYVFVV